MGLLDAVMTHGVRIQRLYGETVHGRPVMDMRYADLDHRLFGLGLQRGALFSVLDAAWRSGRMLHAGRAIVTVDPATGILADSDGKQQGPYDLVIVADGSASGLRQCVARPRLDRPFPWGALWCLVPQARWVWNDELRQRYLKARRMVGMLPVGTRPGDDIPRMSFFWSVPAEVLAKGIHDVATWHRDVADIWPEASASLQGLDVPATLTPARYRDCVMQTWFRDRVVLIGDAAHSMSPQLGQGVNMALMDARTLRDTLRLEGSLQQKLSRYAHERRGHLAIYHFWSRWLTPLFQSDRVMAPRIRDWLFHPLSRLPGGRGQTLRILAGTQHGWFGKLALAPAFLGAIERAQANPPAHEAAPETPGRASTTTCARDPMAD
jgi:2-polyprenyl-6-methoxyphenol hydroxylase-like FAD-dependent oxidoreductase